MVIAVDKFTTGKMYDKVQRLWKEEIKNLVGQTGKSGSDLEKHRLKKLIDFMRRVDMAVVVSGEELFRLLDDAINQAMAFRRERRIDHEQGAYQ